MFFDSNYIEELESVCPRLAGIAYEIDKNNAEALKSSETIGNLPEIIHNEDTRLLSPHSEEIERVLEERKKKKHEEKMAKLESLEKEKRQKWIEENKKKKKERMWRFPVCNYSINIEIRLLQCTRDPFLFDIRCHRIPGGIIINIKHLTSQYERSFCSFLEAKKFLQSTNFKNN